MLVAGTTRLCTNLAPIQSHLEKGKGQAWASVKPLRRPRSPLASPAFTIWEESYYRAVRSFEINIYSFPSRESRCRCTLLAGTWEFFVQRRPRSPLPSSTLLLEMRAITQLFVLSRLISFIPKSGKPIFVFYSRFVEITLENLSQLSLSHVRAILEFLFLFIFLCAFPKPGSWILMDNSCRNKWFWAN